MLIKVNPLGKFEGSPGFITSITVLDQDGEAQVLTPDEDGNIEVDAVTGTELVRIPRFIFNKA